MTEVDRIFRHFRSRDIINENAEAGERSKWLELDTTGAWIGPNFKEGNYKNIRRQLFFPAADVGTWSDHAAADPDPFADEKERAEAKKKKKPPQG